MMIKDYSSKILTIPNILSFIRIGLIPFITVFYYKKNTLLTLAFILLSAVSDVLDGFIARKFNMISSLGKALDPIADKLTLFTLILIISIKKPLMLLVLVVFVIKEILMGVQGLLIIKYTGDTYSAKWYGKLTTTALYLLLILNLVWVNASKLLIISTVILSILLMVFSLLKYSYTNSNKIREAKGK
ncbi:MAG: CDP-alcohol phosphatidyltransferase family protein [Clostridia bacterium]|nr:CDP-alcohol phosphatidyltransferase family protein [Clostridia bacterium]